MNPTQIAARAATLTERFRLFAPPRSTDAAAREQRWIAALGGDRTLFDQRLAHAPLAAEAARAALQADSDWPSPEPLPGWLETLGAVAAQARARAARPLLAAKDFRSFALPWLDVAREQLSIAWPDLPASIVPSALASWEEALTDALLACAYHALALEFSIFEAQHPAASVPWLAPINANSPTHAVAADSRRTFFADLFADGFERFFERYPVLARRLAREVERWRHALEVFRTHLDADRSALARQFNAGADLGRIEAVSAALADAHHGGANVVALTFSTGVRLVYKPRSCALEHALYALQGWCQARDASLEFKAVQVLDRHDHGWMEFVSARECADRDEVRRHYRGSGRLLALVYALGGVDFHAENLIAHGPHAVAIDAEMLISPRIAPETDESGATGAFAEADAALTDSVYNTSLLPNWMPLGREVDLNLGGIGTIFAPAPEDPLAGLPFARERPRGLARDVAARIANAPRLDGAAVGFREHVEDIVDGFVQLYDFLLKHRAPLIGPDGPLAGWAGHTVRFLNRPTDIYGRLQLASRRTPALADGIEHSLVFEQLYQGLAATPSRLQPAMGKLIAAEIAALEDGDIPYFQTRADSRDLPLPDGTVLREFFTISALARLHERIARLSPTDRQRQSDIIRIAFQLAEATDPSRRPVCAVVAPSQAPVRATDAMLAEATASIVRQLRTLAIRVDGAAAWIAPQLVAGSDKYRLLPIGLSLYDGLAGIALFLAAAATSGNDETARELYGEVSATLNCALARTPPARELRRGGIGACHGFGGIIYALTHAAAMMGDALLEARAEALTAALAADIITSDERFDVFGGSAGAILTLLSRYRVTESETARRAAEIAGHHLLARRETAAGGWRTWRTLDAHLTGFSHGAAGIACALLRLHATTGDAEFKAAAEEAIAYEASVFQPAAGNWPDFRPTFRREEGAVYMSTWCHGAPGIGLARLATLDVLDTPAIRADVAAALALTAKHAVTPIDHCCCGNLGRGEILLNAGTQLRHAPWVELAREQAGAVIAAAREAGGYGCYLGLSRGLQNVGFFQGLAGIGYSFLRLRQDARLPGVLQFE